jgi:hypothetical protein
MRLLCPSGQFWLCVRGSSLGSDAIENEWQNRSLFPTSLEDLLCYVLVARVKNARCSKRAQQLVRCLMSHGTFIYIINMLTILQKATRFS